MKKLFSTLITIFLSFAVFGMSACSEGAASILPPSAPENLQWDMEEWTISWDEVAGAESYKLMTDETDDIYETSETEYNFEHILVTDSTNIISVCAVSENGLISDWVQLQVETETPTEALVYTMLDDGLGYEVTRKYSDFTGLEGRVVIADYYDGLPVKSIAEYAFSIMVIGTIIYNTVTTNVHLPKYLENIGESALKNCSSIEEITIPDSVSFVDGYAFMLCKSLKKVNGSLNNITTFSDYVFAYTGLEDFIIHENIISIGNAAFIGCSNLTEIVIPDSVTSIGNYAFSNCDSLVSVTMSSNITAFGENVFYNTAWEDMQMDEYLVIGDGLLYLYQGSETDINLAQAGIKSVAGGAFESNKTLKSIDLSGIKLLGRRIFVSCSALESVANLDCEILYDYTFQYCRNLKNIELPDNLTTIGSHVFEYCQSLTELKIPDSVTSIGASAFCFCSAITEIVIPDGITSIEDSLIRSCSSLKAITIPNSVKTIGWGAFGSCTALEYVFFKGTASEWSKIEITTSSNTALTEDTIYYYSETEPALNGDGTAYNGNFWHYDENGNPVAWVL